MAQMNDFQKAFLAKGTGQQLYTRNEVDAEIDGMIKAFEMRAREFLDIERDACAKIAYDAGQIEIAKQILSRGIKKNDKAETTVPAVDKPQS